MASTQRSFLDSVAALKQRKMLFLFILGMSSGLPFGLTLGTLQAWMKDLSIDLKTIGLFAFLRLPFSLKFLWSPVMDRFALPFLDRRRGWAFLTQILIVIGLIFIANTDPASEIQRLLVLTLLVNIFSASQDIVLDAYRREILKDHELGLGVGIFVNGYILALRYIAGALALLLPQWLGFSWGTVYLLMAVLMGAFSLATLLAPAINPTEPCESPKSLREAFFGPLRDYFTRPEAYTVLAFIILFKLGDVMAGTMTLPFILELGFSKEEYVAIVKVLGPIATFVGALLGGHYVLRFGIKPSLWVMGFFQAVSTAVFSILVWTGKSNLALAAVVGFENLTAQMGTAAYAAYMGSITNVRFTATQYALLSSLMSVPGVIFASRTGVLAKSMGWSVFFIFCALAAVPGMVLIPLLERKDHPGSFSELFRRGVIFITGAAALYAFSVSAWDIAKLFLGV